MSDRAAEARAEAERTYGHAPLGPMRSGLEAGFSHGARWQREALLAADVIEHAAIALFEAAETFGAKKTQWHEQTAEVRADWTRHATTALTAALGIEGEES